MQLLVMRFRMKLVHCVAVCAFALCLAISASAEAGHVVIDATTIKTQAFHGGGMEATDTMTGTTIPSNDYGTAGDGGSSARTDIEFTEAAGTTQFVFDFTHQRAGSPLSFARTIGTHVRFTVDQSSIYNLTGFYNVNDVSESIAGNVDFIVTLKDLTDNSDVVIREQRSTATLDESFTLAGGGGDFDNDTFGSLTGSLIANHQYELFFNATILRPNAGGDNGASSTGNLNLTIAPVPEPSAFVLTGFGLLLLAGFGLWRRGAAVRLSV